MNRATIDYGIDLGTTNSSIAVLRGAISDVIPNNVGNEITASAVFFGRDGQEYVGQKAKDRQKDDRAAGDVCIEFKRRMGTDHLYEFKSAARVMRPEEVSAQVLISLRGDVQQKLGEDVQAAVITVPAAFEARQCVATKRAGELAGFTQCALLQEPVAAALAYGFQVDVTREYWLVYDFGGGTFDAAIMKAEDGGISVVNHDGDNYLGGSDIDWAVLDQLVIPALKTEFNLPEFRRGNKAWTTAIARLKYAIEDAKIRLSRSDTAYLEDCKFKDAAGREIDVEFKLTRNALVGIAEPVILRSVEICKRVLKDKNLSLSAIAKVILVGGPTLAPYFREILASSLGIPLDYSVNALTVVAKGAAVFAGTQRIDVNGLPKASAGQFNIDLTYNPIGADADPTVSGRVYAASGASVEGFAVEFTHQTTDWTSGKIPLRADGRFRLKLVAERGEQNVFGIMLLNGRGSRQVTVPDSIAYTIGATISEQTLMRSIGVALADNAVSLFFSKGDPLPARYRRTYRSTHLVARGSSDTILNIPVVEGQTEIADRNRRLGTLVISGTELRQDVPANSEVEVTLHIDADRIIRVQAYVPIIDEEFEAVIVYNQRSPDPGELKRDYEAEVTRLADLRGSGAVDVRGTVLRDEGFGLDELKTLIDVAQGVPEAAEQAEQQLLALKIKLDEAEGAIKIPALAAEATGALDELDAIIEQHGDADSRAQAAMLREQVGALIIGERPEALRRKFAEVSNLHREILLAQPGFWIAFFDHLVSEQGNMSDQKLAQRLINQGRQWISDGNVQGLRTVVGQLVGLVPREKAEAMQRRGYQSGLLN